jgi:hypothetical protein
MQTVPQNISVMQHDLGNDLSLYHQHLWDGGGSEGDVSKGQVGEEDLHAHMHVGV